NDLKSDDKEKRAAAQKEIDDMKKKADELAKNNPPKKENGPGGKKVDPKEVEKALDDLNSDDPNKREQAKKNLDEMLGKDADEMAKKGGAEVDNDGNINPKGGDPTVPLREAMKEDARNRARSAELQLENFEKNKNNKDLHDAAGMTPEQYKKFLDDFRNYSAK